MRAKVKVSHIVTHEFESGYTMRKVVFSTVMDPTARQDERFHSSNHPVGEITMQMDNPIAVEKFKPGKRFFIEFREAE